METRNESEELFEQYLDLNGFKDKWIHEPSIHGKHKKLDYLLVFKDQQYFFEVKELREKSNETSEQTSGFNPYSSLRKEIHEVRKQFKEYKEFSCSLVVCSLGDSTFRSDPLTIFGAMLGDLGIKATYNSDKNEFVKEEGFLYGGKMIDYGNRKPWNTTISAIVVLEKICDNIEIEKALINEEKKHGMELEMIEWIKIRQNLNKVYNVTRVPRIKVIENPYARIGFPVGLFECPFDERWCWEKESGKVRRIFVGSKLKELEILKNKA
jgi:hypothetical protein